jgi:FkbM family methyltransferase
LTKLDAMRAEPADTVGGATGSIEPQPFGHFAPTRAQQLLIDLANATALGRGRVRWWLSELLQRFRPGPIDAEHLGLKMRLHHDGGNYSEKKFLLHAHQYDRQELAHLLRHDRPQLHFADVGANAGIYSFIVKARRPDARILAFEPDARYCRRMEFNVRTNGFRDFHVIEAAVGAVRGRGRLSLSHATMLSDDDAVDVDVVTLNDTLREKGFARLDALKIDVEGYEDRILFPFFEQAPAALRPGIMVIEHYHRQSWERDCLELCATHGYRPIWNGALNTVLERAH